MTNLPWITLNLMFYFTKDADASKAAPLLKAARVALGQYNVNLYVWPGETANRYTIFESWNKTIDNFEKQGLLLRNAIARQHPTQINHRLPVFFCWMAESLPLQGITLPTDPMPGVLPYVLIDTRKPLTPSRSTLAHEIGHATGLGHDKIDPHNLMFEAGDVRKGTLLSDTQVTTLRAAYFR
jgi:hypothetical protein